METKIINKFECPDCGMEFVAETSRAGCPKCGGICDASSREIFDPGASQEADEGKNDLPAVRKVLLRLCSRSYDVTFKGTEWEGFVDEALDELQPYLKA